MEIIDDKYGNRRRRAERQAAGLCVRCGTEQATEGGDMCFPCHEKQLTRQKSYKRRQQQVKEIAENQHHRCALCNLPLGVLTGRVELVEGMYDVHAVCRPCAETLRGFLNHGRKALLDITELESAYVH